MGDGGWSWSTGSGNETDSIKFGGGGTKVVLHCEQNRVVHIQWPIACARKTIAFNGFILLVYV